MTTGSVAILQPLREEVLGLLRFAWPAVGEVGDNDEPRQRLGKFSHHAEQDVGSARICRYEQVLPSPLLDVSAQHIAFDRVGGEDP